MRITIEYDGKTYVGSNVEKEESIEEYVSSYADDLDKFDNLSIKLENGNYLVLGKKAIQSAVFIFSDK